MKPETTQDSTIKRWFGPISSDGCTAARPQRVAAAFVLFVIYAVVAAAAFNGYYTKWRMSDTVPRQSLVALLDGTAERPFVYRQLLPQIASLIERAMPESVRKRVEQRLSNAKGALKAPGGADATKTGYIIRYRLVYYLTFLSLFLALFVLRSVCLFAGANSAAATAAPAIFALMIPILQTRGGYFYDLPELLAFALAARLALGANIVPLALLAVAGTANKEAFFFYCLTLPPLLMVRLSVRNAIAVSLGAALVAGLTYLAIRTAYATNEGQNALFQLVNNLQFYANPLNLFLLDQTYGLPLFKGYGIVAICWFAILISYGARQVPRYFHEHLTLAALINIPLLLLFAAEGEIRNLSMVYVGLVVFMAGALHRWMKTMAGETKTPPGASAS